MRARYGVATWVLGKSEAGRTSRAKRTTFLSMAVLALVTLATRVLWFGDPVADFDEQIYSLIGWRMTHGDLPFVEVWDRKPFGLFAIFAAAHWLLGPEPIAYQSVACLFAMGCGIGIAFQHLSTRVLASGTAADNDRVSATLGMVQLFASGIGAAIGGVIVNAAGLPQAVDVAGAVAPARWLYGIFAVLTAIAIPFALSVVRAEPAAEPLAAE